MSNNIYARLTGGITRASISGDNAHFPGDDPIGDGEALRQAMRDPRYSKSASYRAMVEEAIAESMVVSSDPNSGQLNGRFQVRGNPIDEAPPAERELTEHEQAMIALAEKHGL
ncbi:hypothetical protein [Bradyrhizobium archetypum]|uniref:Uncharacterized protein n=1 Tax=Bradyrhizobium archetypum TaxID=2721160 RepID=A0A7Y4H682_9BRAD|nr:hypothetical protein [Bradyrhizobium archetypum]NOJ48429.1 hypothetical protein [Bradyrhizobium archetypum]